MAMLNNQRVTCEKTLVGGDWNHGNFVVDFPETVGNGKTISSDELHDFSEGWRKTTNLLGGLEHEFHFSIYHGCSSHMSNINFPMRSLVGGFEPPLWKIMEWVRHLGWFFHSQLFLESHKVPWFQTTNQGVISSYIPTLSQLMRVRGISSLCSFNYIHVWYICQHLGYIDGIHVTIYSSTMDPMGMLLSFPIRSPYPQGPPEIHRPFSGLILDTTRHPTTQTGEAHLWELSALAIITTCTHTHTYIYIYILIYIHSIYIDMADAYKTTNIL